MVAAPETIAADKPKSPAPDNVATAENDDQPDFWKSLTKEAQIDLATTKYDDARKFFAKSELESALDAVALCLEIRTSVFGEKASDLFEPLMLNARALLEQGRFEAGVFKNAFNGVEDVPVEDDDDAEDSADDKKTDDKIEKDELTEEQKEKLADDVEAALDENATRIENKQPLPGENEEPTPASDAAPKAEDAPDAAKADDEPKDAEEKKDGEQEKENEEEGAEGDPQDETDIDDISSYQLAYENAATARLIAENAAQSAAADSDELATWKARVCEALLLLGEISIDDDNYQTAIDDLLTAEDKQRAIFAPDDRRIAETYFQMGRCYTQWNQYDKAAEVYKKSLEVIELLRASTQAKIAGDDSDANTQLAADVKKLDELIVDIKKWVEDSVESHLNNQQYAQEKAKEGDDDKQQPLASKMDDGVVQEVAVRKRKADAPTVADDEAKENGAASAPDTGDDIAAKKAKIAQEAGGVDAPTTA